MASDSTDSFFRREYSASVIPNRRNSSLSSFGGNMSDVCHPAAVTMSFHWHPAKHFSLMPPSSICLTCRDAFESAWAGHLQV